MSKIEGCALVVGGVAIGGVAVGGGFIIKNTIDNLQLDNQNLKSTINAPRTSTATLTPTSTETLMAALKAIGEPTVTQINTLISPTLVMPSLTPNIIYITQTPAIISTINPETQNVEFANNNWDAGDSLHEIKTKDNFLNWYNTEFSKNLAPGVNRSFDRVTKLSYNFRSSVFAKENGDLPQAKEILANATGIGKMALTQLGKTNISDNEAQDMGMKIINKTFNISLNGEVIYTRVSSIQDKKGVSRKRQGESKFCAVYTNNINPGDEYFVDGYMYLPNTVPVSFVSTVISESFNDPDIMELPIKNANGENVILAWIFQDNGSQPNKEKSGLDQPDGLTAENSFNGDGWGSIMQEPCGPAAAKAAATAAPTVLMAQTGMVTPFGPGETPGTEVTGTPVPPTVTFSPGQTAVPTATGIGPTPFAPTPLNTAKPTDIVAPTVPPVAAPSSTPSF